MNKLERSVLDFLMSGMVYSDGAIMKNLGINEIELENIYVSLTEQGYLESYEEFLKKNPDYQKGEEESLSCSSGCGSNCSSCSTSSGCGGCSSNSDDIDYSKIKVLTEKAFTFTF